MNLLRFDMMKKIVYLSAALFFAFAFTGCDDSNELPDVSFDVAISGASFANGEIYVAQGNSIEIEEVKVVNNEYGRNATIPYVNYYFNYNFIGQNAIEPYNFTIDIPDNLPLGEYSLELTAPVFATDKEPGYAIVTYKVKVVESAEDIPSDATQTARTAAHTTDQNSNS